MSFTANALAPFHKIFQRTSKLRTCVGPSLPRTHVQHIGDLFGLLIMMLLKLMYIFLMYRQLKRIGVLFYRTLSCL